jgi:hypothetical protein
MYISQKILLVVLLVFGAQGVQAADSAGRSGDDSPSLELIALKGALAGGSKSDRHAAVAVVTGSTDSSSAALAAIKQLERVRNERNKVRLLVYQQLARADELAAQIAEMVAARAAAGTPVDKAVHAQVLADNAALWAALQE